MKCHICEQNMKEFKFDVPKEFIFQCKECNYNINIQKNIMTISLNDRVNISEFTNLQNYRTWSFYYSKDKYNRVKEIKMWKKIENIINIYRTRNKKKKIKYFHPLKIKCGRCKKIKYIKYFGKFNNKKRHTKYRYYCRKCESNDNKRYYYNYDNIKKNRYRVIRKLQKKKFKKELNFTFNDFLKWIDDDKFNKLYDNYINKNKENSYTISIFRKNIKDDYNLSNLALGTRKDFGKNVANYVNKNKKRNVRIVQLDNNKIVQMFSSIKDTEKYGFIRCCVNQCCLGNRKSHAGYQWKYLKDL